MKKYKWREEDLFVSKHVIYKPISGMTKIASESPATKTEEPCIDILFTGKICFAIIGLVSTRFFTNSEFSQIFCAELVLKNNKHALCFKEYIHIDM